MQMLTLEKSEGRYAKDREQHVQSLTGMEKQGELRISGDYCVCEMDRVGRLCACHFVNPQI